VVPARLCITARRRHYRKNGEKSDRTDESVSQHTAQSPNQDEKMTSASALREAIEPEAR